MVAISGMSVWNYVKLYNFDRDKKGCLLDLKPLGQQKNYIDFSRLKMHAVKLNSENKVIMMSPLL